MTDWMRALASHYEDMRRRYPDDRLLVVFDVDGTILDMRHMIRHLLLAYDRAHASSYFHGLEAEQIRVHENEVDRLLEQLLVPVPIRARIVKWYLAHRWTSAAVLASHRPYQGVLEVVRWFQIQPRTCVGLNTGRPESLREDTLRSLNALGQEYRVGFTSKLLRMNPRGREQAVAAAKVDGIRHFQQNGYRIVAVVDNEPSNIEAMAQADLDGRILFLHADTIFQSKRVPTPRTVSGQRYDITNLLSEERLPQHVNFVWHGVNDRANLRQFCASPVYWGECDVRRDPLGRIVLRHDSFDDAPWSRDEQCMTLKDCLAAFRRHGKGIKLDLKEGEPPLGRVLKLLDQAGLEGGQIWFNGCIETLGESGFRRLSAARPGAVIQCPVDFLAPLILGLPEQAQKILELLKGWGINRFSVGWNSQPKRRVLSWLQDRGYEVNIYDVPDLEAFLQAALLLPRSLTADFNFPQWQYFGRGSGQRQNYHCYSLDRGSPVSLPA